MRSSSCVLLAAVVSIAGAGQLGAARGQQPARPGPSIWDGIYSVNQAARGRIVFETHCARCHTQEQSLTGPVFMLHWEGHTVASLFRKIRETMPADNVQGISDGQKLDAMAFVLAENGYPAGAMELDSDMDVLAAIDILPKGGPRPLPSGAVVQASGCLTAASGDWMLTDATEPSATTLEVEPASRLDPGLSPPTGNQRFHLLDVYPSPVQHRGHAVRVKGFLIRNPQGDRINVVSLAAYGVPCAPGDVQHDKQK